MWRTIVNSRLGKVWTSAPNQTGMYLVADLEDDQEHYYDTIINITHLRNLEGDEESINIAYNEYKKNFEKTVDPDVNLGHNLNSDRGNPSDL